MEADALPFMPQLLEAFPQKQSARFVIGIVGPPASGKSTLTDQLVEQLNQSLERQIAARLRMDAYHRTNQDLQERGTLLWKGCHFTFDGEAYLQKLRQVRNEPADCWCPIYDRSRSIDPIPDAQQIKQHHEIVVTEGNYLLTDIEPWRQIANLLDYVIFIDVDPEIQKERLLERHQRSGRSAEEALAKMQSTDLPNTVFIRQSLANIDFKFRPSANFE